MHSYQVSVIMAVYNVAPFLREAIGSVIAQTIGFHNIQLILVDDGSTDESGAICDEYAARHPGNILVIHKENGGVSSARNAGLPHAQGKYLNFMDADDTLSENVCTKVTEFFDRHYEDIDAVAFPMFFFDGKTGPHILNDKFCKGSRVIDLRKEYDKIQLSTASCFLKREAVENHSLRYDERLCFTEDAKLLCDLLCRKLRLGVVSTCRYRVRRRSTAAPSATQQSASRRQWWLDTLRHFQMETIQTCLARYGHLPRYAQYLMCYDLQWRLQQPEFPRNLLTAAESEAYRVLLAQVLSRIDDSIIWQQKSIYREHKIYALKMKYGKPAETVQTRENIQLYYGETEVFSLMDYGVNLAFGELGRDFCKIEGFLMLPADAPEGFRMEVHCGSQVFPCDSVPGPNCTRILDTPVQKSLGFSVRIPLPSRCEPAILTFHAVLGKTEVTFHALRLGKHFPLTRSYAAAYFYGYGRKLTCQKNTLVIQPCGVLSHLVIEGQLLRELCRKGSKKAAAARILRHMLCVSKRKPLILLSDRVDRAGDNGEAMFRYLRRHHRKDVSAVFLLRRSSPDFGAMKKIGPVVDFHSPAHKLLHLMADYVLSSGAEVHTINPFTGYGHSYADLTARVKFVFLQHGETKDDISGWINRYDKNIFGIICAARAEHDAFLAPSYGYPAEHIWLTGFPRFDRLYRSEENCIAILPTWRKALMGGLNPATGKWDVAAGFSESEYLRFYRSLLNHPRLRGGLEQFGYRLLFMPHPNLVDAIGEFEVPNYVHIPVPDTAYRDLFACSRLVVTDYSSAVFDFAYLRKPVVYCQFDAAAFFSGSHSYQKGYFDYARDGFGEVTHTLEDTVDCLITHMRNGCTMTPEYHSRADRFFAFDDRENCRRVYEKLVESQ